MAYVITRRFLDDVEYNQDSMAASFDSVFGNINKVSANVSDLNLIVGSGGVLLKGYFLSLVGTETIPITTDKKGYIYFGYDFSNDTYEINFSETIPVDTATIAYTIFFDIDTTGGVLRFYGKDKYQHNIVIENTSNNSYINYSFINNVNNAYANANDSFLALRDLLGASDIDYPCSGSLRYNDGSRVNEVIPYAINTGTTTMRFQGFDIVVNVKRTISPSFANAKFTDTLLPI